jgi:hypothetical protein
MKTRNYYTHNIAVAVGIIALLAIAFLAVEVASAQPADRLECVELLKPWNGNAAGLQVQVDYNGASNMVEHGIGEYCTLGIEIDPLTDVDVPVTFAVSNAYPNPFNPITTFELAVPVEQSVTVDVFDILGQRVERMNLGTLSAETTYTVRLDASGYSSGTYIVRFSGPNFATSKSVVLMK